MIMTKQELENNMTKVTGIPVEISTSTCTGIALIPSKTAVLTVLYIYTPIPIGVNA